MTFKKVFPLPSPPSSITTTITSFSVLCLLSLQLFICAESPSKYDVNFNGSNIVESAVAADKSFPFQVFLEIPQPPNSTMVDLCSGSIIKHPNSNSSSESDSDLGDRYKILTGAHCFDNIIQNNQSSDKDLLILVIMGANNIVTQRNRGKVLKIKFGTVKIHPDYNERTNGNDLAIIPLPADFKPVPGLYDAIGLAPSSDESRNYAETEVQVAGWGAYNALGDDSAQLLFIRSKILEDDVCEEFRLASGSPGLYSGKYLCTDGTGEKGSCHGDSGGPLIAWALSTVSTSKPTPIIIGIASYRLTTQCAGSTPTFFIRVVKYLDWISTTI